MALPDSPCPYAGVVLVYGLIVCATASAGLAAMTSFHPEQSTFKRRFTRFFGLYCCPGWLLLELAHWLAFHRFFP